VTPRVLGLTATALVAFAANSWLCRAALRSGSIDPATFTAVRIASGALALALIAGAVARSRSAGAGAGSEGDAASAAALLGYAVLFSFAYLSLDSGLGSLVLFGAVQLTMLGAGIAAGHRVTAGEGAGLVIAVAGLAVLAAPGAAAPPPAALAAMAAAGVSWGVYSLRGRSARRPLAATAGNFRKALLPALALLALPLLGAWSPAADLAPPHRATAAGLALAVISGAVTSGLGYAVWYAALPGLSRLRAGLVQLAVPVIAAAGGAVALGERIPLRLAVAAAMVLGGIALAIWRAPLPASGRTPGPATD
jgi:drug/metabolite transporter (DMT)-like permease